MSDSLNEYRNESSAIPVRFTRLYIILLGILTLLLTVSQGLTQWRLWAVQDELWVIRYAALQRNQSQQIAKLALQIADARTPAEFNQKLNELRQRFPAFERYHLQGRKGRVRDKDLDVHVPNSERIEQLYAEIWPDFSTFRQGAKQLTLLRQPDDLQQPIYQQAIRQILASEKPFLEEIDGIVREYTSELRAKLTLLQTIEFCLYIFTMLVLMGIGLFIFRPAVKRLKKTFVQLTQAESRATAANQKLLAANRTLKETRKKLFEATRQQYRREISEQKLRTSYLIAGQEEERKRLSRELHDGLGQMLTAIKLQIEGLETSLVRSGAAEPGQTAGYAKNLKTLKNLVTQTIQETRTISNNLMPTVLSDFGILPAIKMLVENDRTEEVDVRFETNLTPDMPRLKRDVEIMLYRVTQEAISNAIRHGKPSHILIELMSHEKTLQLAVTDDGVGFKPSRKRDPVSSSAETVVLPGAANGPIRQKAPSQGLHNMQERTKSLNGKFKLYSTPGKGTRVVVTIPLQTPITQYDPH